ncbi:YiiX family permuted papain-like enzyme [Sphingobacterium deserti]|uniref:Peptidoglycan peptidase n=1 Tax=Sphingobacterium deserti TaxID=1229276 RepID=A0A0B8T343_9SPHI|nr:YiiX family permuted papain-like enzyme [Sphingobacterium deserti]KGE15877.1 peptidoglycan peptidase [Sphingobacterium deserti]
MKKGWKYFCLGIVLLLNCGYMHAGRDLPSSTGRRPYISNISWEQFQSGDIIFQTSLSGQSKAIMLATESPYSHCGIIWRENNELYVWEAVQSVKKTPFKEWIAQGKNKAFQVKRLRNADALLPQAAFAKLNEELKQHEGKPYDTAFEWSVEKVYCSELVYKVYERAIGLKIGKLQKMKELNLGNSTVQSQLKKRYGSRIPFDMLVITPAAIYQSELLMDIE